MIQTNYLAKRIKSIYDFNDFEIKPDKLKLVVERMEALITKYKLKDEKIILFFDMLDNGELGGFYKNPSSFLGLFYKFQDENRTKLKI